MSIHELHDLCKEIISPDIALFNVQEMIGQHTSTYDILSTVFGDTLNLNPISRKLQEIVPQDDIPKIITDNYHAVIQTTYADLYKARNPAKADRLGIVYTPIEIIRFMIESTDYLLHKHFDKSLSDRNLYILDPATGTGAFITELLCYLPNHCLEYKYRNDIHGNEIDILPYYIASLNIEHTCSQEIGRYASYDNLLLLDTLKDTCPDKYDVIIGNPPYNHNQLNENENNKNREYPGVDKRIKNTYIKHSTAQKTKLYDMYSRFIRWASDRLDENGVVAFITNRSFVDARTFDGFRKVVTDEFSHIYVVDLGGDVRENPKLSGPKHNVFAIQTGVAISFFVKKADAKNEPCQIHYVRRPEMETTREKLHFLATNKFKDLPFEHIQPDKNHNWLGLTDNDWDELLPIASRKTDVGTIFRLLAPGVNTARGEWVYDFQISNLQNKMRFFIDVYNQQVDKLSHYTDISSINDLLDYSIKWSRDLKNQLLRNRQVIYNDNKIIVSSFRPFVKKYFYSEFILNDVLTSNHQRMWGNNLSEENVAISISGSNSPKPFTVLATNTISDFNSLSPAADGCRVMPLYRYTEDGHRVDNITAYALKQFQEHYEDTTITRLNIFHYIYAVLHHPAYREKYKLNLKREFPRIPFYDDFWQWAGWGQTLMDLHLNYETATLYPLQQVDKPANPDKPPVTPKAKLKADKIAGTIELDTVTTLKGVPASAWDYKLGNRSALEWVLDRYKERKPRDPTIRDKFNTYRLADYKEQVIELLQRVCTVSVETMKIIAEMRTII